MVTKKKVEETDPTPQTESPVDFPASGDVYYYQTDNTNPYPMGSIHEKNGTRWQVNAILTGDFGVFVIEFRRLA